MKSKLLKAKKRRIKRSHQDFHWDSIRYKKRQRRLDLIEEGRVRQFMLTYVEPTEEELQIWWKELCAEYDIEDDGTWNN